MLGAMSMFRRWGGRMVDAVGAAFVTETVADDGTRLLLALDPSFHGFDVVVVVDELERVDWRVPDDIRELI